MRISEKFKELEDKGEKALILYISCGDGDTLKIAKEVIDAGCDILELGLPFSDPIADGPTIQAASQRAIEHGMNTDKYFEIVRKIEGVPKVCMTYYNLIYQYGLDRFAKEAVKSGITGLIVPDLPPEEAEDLRKACDANGVDLIFIASPATSENRLDSIKTRIPEGFLYLQSVLGVTGARETMKTDLGPKIKHLKEKFQIPIAVGFGVSTPEQAKDLADQGADGIIVGSALIKKIKEGQNLSSFVKSLKQGLK